MKQHRGHWSRGAWPKKASPLEVAHSSLWLKSLPMRNAVKDESGTWTEIVRVEDSGCCWDSQAFDISFFDDNKKIFQWDDSGASDYLKKVEVKLQQGISSVYADYLNDSNQFSASIDWDERRLCTLPDCAEDLVNRDEKRKILRGSFTRRDPSESVNAVIFGLPEPQNGTGCSSTPSLRLPLDFVPFPTGWDDGEDNPAEALCEDLPLQPLTATDAKETLVRPSPGPLRATDAKDTQVQLPPRSLWHASMNSNQVPRIPGLGWPEYPSSYQHIIPSGWEDVQIDQPVTGCQNEEAKRTITNQVPQELCRGREDQFPLNTELTTIPDLLGQDEQNAPRPSGRQPILPLMEIFNCGKRQGGVLVMSVWDLEFTMELEPFNFDMINSGLSSCSFPS